MKTIEIDDDLYAFIAGQTKHIGESASQILRRLLMTDSVEDTSTSAEAAEPVVDTPAAEPETAPVEVKKAAPNPVPAPTTPMMTTTMTASM